MSTEISFFDPDAIRTMLDRDLAAGLRALAEAIESRSMTGRCIQAEGIGFGSKNGDASVLVRLVVSAPVRVVRRLTDVAQLGSGDELEKVD